MDWPGSNAWPCIKLFPRNSWNLTGREYMRKISVARQVVGSLLVSAWLFWKEKKTCHWHCFMLGLVLAKYLEKWLHVYVSRGNKTFIPRSNQPTVNPLWSTNIAVCVKGFLCYRVCDYVYLNNLKYTSIISNHQNYTS